MDSEHLFDRTRLVFEPLAQRPNRVTIARERIDSSTTPPPAPSETRAAIERAARAIRAARAADKPVILAFGAHAIKNGLGPLLAEFVERGWITHLATNGAGVIHDWEFAYQGQSSEHVRENVAAGRFGLWAETGAYLNLALVAGAYRGLGYGEAVGAFIAEDGVAVPSEEDLRQAIRTACAIDPTRAAAAADFLAVLRRGELAPGRLAVAHPFREHSLQYRAWRAQVPFTAHPMFGHDIIYTHPLSCGAAVGRTAERDFLRFAGSVSALTDGVYLSVGSAVMSPMIFEKSLSMAQNLARQRGERLERHRIFIVDLAPCPWDWSAGEPPEDNPAYYMRYLKSFSRMGGHMEYIGADNRAFFLHLWQALERRGA